jgi:hypothetical protein
MVVLVGIPGAMVGGEQRGFNSQSGSYLFVIHLFVMKQIFWELREF